MVATLNNYTLNWTSFTPTGSWSANTTYSGYYKEIGDNLDIIIKVACSGAPTSATLTLDMPSGVTIDTTKLVATVNGVLGNVAVSNTGTNVFPGFITYATSTTVNVVTPTANILTGLNTNTAVTQAAPFTFGNTDFVYARFSVPI